jgi:hypothetical protein
VHDSRVDFQEHDVLSYLDHSLNLLGPKHVQASEKTLGAAYPLHQVGLKLLISSYTLQYERVFGMHLHLVVQVNQFLILLH